MTIQTTQAKKKHPINTDERILVVKRSDLFPGDTWHGIKPVDLDEYLKIIEKKKQFLWRSQMEQDPIYKQIIPYLVFKNQNKYFLMQRAATASEKRLRNKYSLGIGGHIRQEDMTHSSLFAWAKREFHEEIEYNGSFKIELIGLLNDDSNPVGRVHIGFVLLLTGDTENIQVKSELKNGVLSTLSECELVYDNLESWSQLVLEHLKNKL